MLIIDDRIVVVHIPKGGGTSFCRGLFKLLPQERVKAFWNAGKKRSPRALGKLGGEQSGLWKHSTAADFVASRGGSKDNHRLVLVSVRPYAHRVISYYFYCRRAHKRDPNRYPWIEGMSFSTYLQSPQVYDFTVPGFATSASGEVLVDQFVPYADLSACYTALCDELGYPGQTLPHLNIGGSKKRDYAAMYGPAELALVKAMFREEDEFLAQIESRTA